MFNAKHTKDISNKVRYKWGSESTIIIGYGSRISCQCNQKRMKFKHVINKKEFPKLIIYISYGCTSKKKKKRSILNLLEKQESEEIDYLQN